jgi:hypothetical protein
MLDRIRKEFDKAVKKKLRKKPEVRDYVLKHCGKERCIEKIAEQVKIAELSNIGGAFDVAKYREIIKAGADLFVYVSLEILEQAHRTQAERRRIEDENNRIAEIEAEQVELKAEIESDKIVSYPSV